ncbi:MULTISPECIES: helix-turn-helix domain-containing protein [Fructilactobacillus]|uniref:Helix-turn-helix domain-containing protein n=1 Tax=Fructilactobacillus carniphilus TaxID=2940297 RepID=A0ABY5BWH5_9LACO|nr:MULTISPECIES: helix-turn-helix transcriptional regulator [Fructilactobacillus]USS86089.1 helix-turn-helix domain-containing protein [Fructilactobacillus cliffordii]USS90596.1 helix-turn-helix domain-containing protein [Fructilactobacillus carniphilus]
MFPERLKALRTGKHITLAELATELNEMFPSDKRHENTASQIGNWERGIRNPSYVEVRKLATYFGISMDYLSGRVDSEKTDLSKLFISGTDLYFNEQLLTGNDRYEIYQLIDGFLHGKKGRHDDGRDTQEELDLNY